MHLLLQVQRTEVLYWKVENSELYTAPNFPCLIAYTDVDHFYALLAMEYPGLFMVCVPAKSFSLTSKQKLLALWIFLSCVSLWRDSGRSWWERSVSSQCLSLGSWRLYPEALSRGQQGSCHRGVLYVHRDCKWVWLIIFTGGGGEGRQKCLTDWVFSVRRWSFNCYALIMI